MLSVYDGLCLIIADFKNGAGEMGEFQVKINQSFFLFVKYLITYIKKIINKDARTCKQ